uniref:Proteinase-activated receptor 1 n=1 Tax=Leptobrachium leishanense TaxID=445787 RepID=A0A8C5Q482_9ANUR
MSRTDSLFTPQELQMHCFNVRGLDIPEKQTHLLKELRSSRTSVAFLQKTHFWAGSAPTLGGQSGDIPRILVGSFLISNVTFTFLSSVWLTKFIPSVYTVVFIIAIPLNVLSILIVIFKMKIRKPAVVYMLNLAVADVLFISVLPFKITYHFLGNNWPFGSGMCRFVTAAFYCNMYCSILLMTSISVDRFLAIVYPIHSLTWRTLGRSYLVCSLIWMISIASIVPLVIYDQTADIKELEITTCHDVLEIKENQIFYVYYFSTICLLYYFIPLLITTASYFRIIRNLVSSNNRDTLKRSRAVFLSLVVFCIFLFCFGPTNVILLTHILNFTPGVSESLYFAYMLCVCVSSISCCLDPLIYYYVSPDCRRYLYILLRCKKASKLDKNRAF